MPQKQHVIHGRDHAPGGSDPIPGLGSGGGGDGIQFDTYPQEGYFLEITTTDNNPVTGAGIRLNTGTLAVVASEDIVMDVTDETDGQFLITALHVLFNGVASGATFQVSADTSVQLGAAGSNFSLDASKIVLSTNSGDMEIVFPFEGGDLAVKAYVGSTLQDIFKVSQGGYGGGSPSYHIKSGASWVADL